MNQRVVPTKQVETTDLVRGNWIWSYRIGGMTRCCREARSARIVTVTDPSGFFVEQGTDISCAPGAMRPDLVWRLQHASTYNYTIASLPLHTTPRIDSSRVRYNLSRLSTGAAHDNVNAN